VCLVAESLVETVFRCRTQTANTRKTGNGTRAGDRSAGHVVLRLHTLSSRSDPESASMIGTGELIVASDLG